jgi:hypothetical protein
MIKKAFNTLIETFRRNPLDLVLLALVLPGAWMLRLWWIETIPTEQLYDFSTYYEVAVNISKGLGYTFLGQPIAFQGMGYSILLGYFFKLMGDASELTAKHFNLWLSMWSILMTYLIAWRMSPLRRVRWGALLLMAFMPQQIAYTNAIGTEILSAALLSTLMLIQCSGDILKAKYQWPVLGMLTAALALTKPFYLAYPVAVLFYEWLTRKDFKRGVAGALIVAAVMMVIVAPWTYRNYRHFGRFIPVSYNSGLVLYLNNNANNTHGGYMPLEQIEATPELQEKIDAHLEFGARSIKLASDLEIDLKPVAQTWIRENFGEFMKLGIIRVHSTFFNGSWDVDAWTMNKYRTLETERTEVETVRHLAFFRSVNDMVLSILAGTSLLFFLLRLPDFVAALFSLKRRLDWQTVLLMLPIGYNGLMILVYEGQPRYNFNILFVFVLCVMLVSQKLLIQDQSLANHPGRKTRSGHSKSSGHTQKGRG